MNCQHCQPLLLDHLYGLLDGPDEDAVRAHLATCPACAAALDNTARVQGLIARAAKSAFPDTQFEAPVEQPAKVGSVTPAPATPALPLAAKAGRGLRLAAVVSWAVAAAVLLAIPGTVIPVLNTFNEATRAKFEADGARREADLLAGNVEFVKAGALRRQSDAEFKVTVAEQSQTALLNQWTEAQKAALATATSRLLTIDVQKPATVQPGAPNEFVVVVNDGRAQWERSGKRMVAEVHAVGASDAVIFTQSIDSERAADKTHPLRLPASAWTKVKPDAELFLVVAQVDEKTQARTELLERVKLAGPVFTTLLVTDKAQYRPGERLFFRSLTLDRVSLRPPGREQVLRYELRHPNGRPVTGLSVSGTTDLVRVGTEGKVEPVRMADGAPVRGVGSGEFVLPPDLADGDYTLTLHESPHPGGFPAAVAAPVTRKVTVRSGDPDHFRKMLGFTRGSFAAGETVEAWGELAFQEKPVPNAEVLAVVAQVDGNPVAVTAPKTTDANGRLTMRFALPPEIQTGDTRLKVTFRTPLGTEEMVAKPVPVIGRRLNVEFFPECGDVLVAGVPCKVYVRATTPAGIAVDLRGIVTDGRRELARVETLTDKGEPGANRGLAAFTFTPELGTRVWLKLESPTGAFAPILPDVPVANASVALLGGAAATGTRTGYPLPAPKAEGVVMSVLDPVTAPGEPIRVRLHSVGQPRQLVVGAYTRGKLSDTQKVTVEPEVPQVVKLMAGADARGGVVRVTAFEEPEDGGDLKPVAERLVFRKPGEALNIACTVAMPDGRALSVASATPPALESGALAKLSISATDEKGNPAAAILWAAAVNSGAAPGSRDRLMPTHFLLAGEVKKPDDLEYADFLLNDEHPKAAVALDLVLGTQGWRRFAEQSPASLDMVRVQPAAGNAVVPHPEVVRLQAQNGQYNVLTEPPLARENRKVAETFGPRYEAAVQAVAQARRKLDEARAASSDPQPVQTAARLADDARKTADEKAASAEAARRPVQAFRAGVWYGVAGLFLLALGCGVVAVLRPADRFPLGFSTLGSLGLAAFLLVASGWTDEARAAASAGAAQADRAEAKRAAPTAVGPRRGGEAETFAMDALATADGKLEFGLSKPPGDAPPAKTGFNGFGPAAGLAPGKPLPKWPFGGPPSVASGGVGGFPQAKMEPPPAAPSALPSGPATTVTPTALPAPPGPAGMNDAAGGPNRGVSRADLLDGRPTPLAGKAKGADRTAEHADELKRAAARAVTYANDRANTLTEAMDAYFLQRQRLRDKQADAKPQALEKMPDVDKVVAWQIRGQVARAQPPLVVREYAAPRPTSPLSADTSEDTVLWQPVIVLPADGKATLTFHLGAAPGGYQVVVAGHTADGRLGAVRGLIRTTPPRTVGPAAAVPQAIPAAPPMP